MNWLSEFGLFVAEALTIVAAIGAVIALVARARGQAAPSRQSMKIRDRQEYYRQYREQLEDARLEKGARAAVRKTREKARAQTLKKHRKAARKSGTEPTGPTLWVLDFHGDIRASREPAFSQEITALLPLLTPDDEVLVRLESGGGLVHSYGLASAQMDRLKASGARLTVSVDKVAASGGYMMACCADHLLAAPFAVIGSIGVVAQIPNFHRLLKKNDVDVEVLTAGRHKRTLTLLGENTDEGREKFLEDLSKTHDLFKTHVAARRPRLDMDQVAEGDVWYGTQAVDLGLIDEVLTSDDYLQRRAEEARILEVQLVTKKSALARLGKSASIMVDKGMDRRVQQDMEQRWNRM